MQVDKTCFNWHSGTEKYLKAYWRKLIAANLQKKYFPTKNKQSGVYQEKKSLEIF